MCSSNVYKNKDLSLHWGVPMLFANNYGFNARGIDISIPGTKATPSAGWSLSRAAHPVIVLSAETPLPCWGSVWIGRRARMQGGRLSGWTFTIFDQRIPRPLPIVSIGKYIFRGWGLDHAGPANGSKALMSLTCTILLYTYIPCPTAFINIDILQRIYIFDPRWLYSLDTQYVPKQLTVSLLLH